jgi:serine phosphatase RsbU (regulator of sigma subunit)
MLYGEERLNEAVKNTSSESGEGVIDYILKDIRSFAQDVPQFDDITMVVLSIK